MQKSSLFKSKKRGFTLIEILVVLAIISILASIVLINVKTTKQKAKRAAAFQSFHEITQAMSIYYEGDWPTGYWGWGVQPPFVLETYPKWDATYFCNGCKYVLSMGDSWPQDGKAGCGYLYIYDIPFTNYIYKYIICDDCPTLCNVSNYMQN